MSPQTPAALQKLFKYIDENKLKFIETLAEAVEIPSVSASIERRQDVVKMVHWTEKRLKELGAETTLRDLGSQTFPGGQTAPLPPAILGSLGNDPAKKTVLVYGHLDVQPAQKEDGWDTDPFKLTEKDNKLYGRGSSDDKGPVICWLNAIEAFQKTGQQVPVNIKFVFEGMEESGSEGLDELLEKEKNGFLANVDYVCISDNYWLGKEKPCITYGLRGICYFDVEIQCAAKDLHSGIFGGSVYEALPDLVYILNSLTDAEGKILIPGIYDDVAPLIEREHDIYGKISFDVDVYRQDVGAKKLRHKEDKTQILMHRWRYPSLSLHGIEGAFAEPGQKTVIPAKVIGKFSLRIVPNQTPEKIEQNVKEYVEKLWKARGSPNSIICRMAHGGKCWTEDPNHPHYVAAQKATLHAYNTEADLTREGGSIPVTITLQETTQKNVILLPVGAADDGAHSQNEKIDIRNYIQGAKLLGAYLYEVSQL